MDRIELQVIAQSLLAAAETMGIVLVRSAFSPNIKERKDCSTAIFDSKGRLIAQAEHIPLHLGSMLGVVEAVTQRYTVTELESGDIIVSNDPYLGGGTHLPDVTCVSPFFFEGELSGFVACVAHHSDIGADIPGGISGKATSIDEEGVRIPPTKFVNAGVADNPTVEDFVRRCRMPEQRRLDLRGQFAACEAGCRKLEELFSARGREAVIKAQEVLLEYSERRLREAIRDVPDGAYEATDHLDDDGFEAEMIPVRCLLAIDGDQLSLDFGGSGPQVKGAINVVMNALRATVYYAVKAALDPEVPSNAGLHAAVTISAPAGSIVNCTAPAAVGARTDTCQRIAGVILSAFAKAIPDRIPAPSNDASTAVTFYGTDPRTKQEYVYVEAVAGGAGARPDSDGLDGVQVHITNTSNLPVESLENEYPLLVEAYELMEGSGGRGKYRGGMGLRRRVRVERGTSEFSSHGDRHKTVAKGLAGGGDGAPGRLTLNPGTDRVKALPSKSAGVILEEGDVVRIETPGGAAWGPPD